MHKLNAEFLAACADQQAAVDLHLMQLLGGLGRADFPRPVPIATQADQRYTLFNRRAREAYMPPPTYAPLKVDQLPSNPIIQFYGALLNATHLVDDPRPAAFTSPGPVKYYYTTCSYVEEAWSRSVISAQRPGKLSKPLVQVFTDAQGHPLALRKGRGDHPTGVLLEPLAAQAGRRHRIVCPPGSIVQIDSHEDSQLLSGQLDEDKQLTFPNRHSIVSPVTTIKGIVFDRLSPLVCDDPLQAREQFPERIDMLTIDRPLERLREMAHNIIAFSQTVGTP